MPYFVYIKESETGRVLSFGAYDTPPIIVSQGGDKFVIPGFSPSMLSTTDN